jgi:hypothetical protein
MVLHSISAGMPMLTHRPIFVCLCFTCQIIAISWFGKYKISQSRLKDSHSEFFEEFPQFLQETVWHVAKKYCYCYFLRLWPLFILILFMQLQWFFCLRPWCRNCVKIQTCSLNGYVTAWVEAAIHVCAGLHRVHFVLPKPWNSDIV